MSDVVTTESLRALLSGDVRVLASSPSKLRQFLNATLHTLTDKDSTIEALRRDLHYALNRGRFSDSSAAVILSLLRTLPADQRDDVFASHAAAVLAAASERVAAANAATLSWRNKTMTLSAAVEKARAAAGHGDMEAVLAALTVDVGSDVQPPTPRADAVDGSGWFNVDDEPSHSDEPTTEPGNEPDIGATIEPVSGQPSRSTGASSDRVAAAGSELVADDSLDDLFT